MRRCASVFACLLLLALFFGGRAQAAASIVASYTLDPAPSWQSSSQKAEFGSWVKHSSPVVANVDGVPTIFVGSQGGKVYALRYSNGRLTKLWSGDTGTFVDSSPAVADINGDGCPEVLVGAGNEFHPANSGVHVWDCHGKNHRFWSAPQGPRSNHVGVFSTPAIGDVNGDHKADIVYGSFNQKLYVKDANGHDLPGWPHENYDTIWSSPALADIDGDGKQEIITGTDLGGGAPVWTCARGIRGTISVFKGDGSFAPNFPRCMDTPIWSSPAVQDVNGNGSLDIIVGTNNYTENGGPVGRSNVLRAVDSRSGAELWSTTIGSSDSRVFASPAVGDVGGNGSLDVAVGTVPHSGGPGEMYLLDARTGAIRWHHKSGATYSCSCEFMGSPVIGDVDGDGKGDVIALTLDGGIEAWTNSGAFIIKDLHATRPGTKDSRSFFNSPAVADLDGNGTNELVVASAVLGSNPLQGKVWIVETSGKGSSAWPFFKKTTDRLSATGTGAKYVAPTSPTAPPAPAPTTTHHTTTHHHATPSATSHATASPVPTTASTDAPPTGTPFAFAPPSQPPAKSSTAWPLFAGTGLGIAAIGGGGVLLYRRRVHQS